MKSNCSNFLRPGSGWLFRSFRAAARVMLVVTAISYTACQGQGAPALTARLKAAQTMSSLDGAGAKPWHLKLALTFYNGTSASGEGTVEEWWGAPDRQKVTYALPSYNGTILRLGSEEYRTKDLTSAPAAVEGLLAQFVHPMANSDIDGTRPDLRKQKFGAVQLDCIMLDAQLKNVAFPPLGLFPTYCLDPGKETLRISYDVGSDVYLRNGSGHFQERSVPIHVTLQVAETRVASADLTALSSFEPEDSDFKPLPEMQAAHDKAVAVSGGVMNGAILRKITPAYPESAKLRHITGTVLLRAIIGRDGQVHSLRLISTPDADLAMAAVAAVKHWTYKPYLLNGIPTEVDTSITVNFSFGPQ